MPAPIRADLEEMIRLLTERSDLILDDTFGRRFNRLPAAYRQIVVDAVTARRETPTTPRPVRPPQPPAAISRGEYVVSSGEAETVRTALETWRTPPPPSEPMTIDGVPVRIDEWGQLDDVPEDQPDPGLRAELTARMREEIAAYRQHAQDQYMRERRPRTEQEFLAFSRTVEDNAARIRHRWEQRIAAACAPPPTRWPRWQDFLDYDDASEARLAFRNAMDEAWRARLRDAPGTGGRSDWETFYSMGIAEITSSYARREAASSASPIPPPPTTTPWMPRRGIGQTTAMVKALPRSGRAVVIAPTAQIRAHILGLVRTELRGTWVNLHITSMSAAEHDAHAALALIRSWRKPIFIDHTVFDMHAAGTLPWRPEFLDQLIALQAEIPDEETAT